MERALETSIALLIETIHDLLASRDLSLSEVSRASHSLVPDHHLQRIPRNLYSLMRNRNFSPNLFQIFSLSTITGYRFADWLSVFGFSLYNIPLFQTIFPALRTVALDSGAWHTTRVQRWFREERKPDFSAPLMPLANWLGLTGPTFYRLPSRITSDHRYVKIGVQDAFAFPELVPGSIVRIRSRHFSRVRSTLDSKPSRTLFLIEHSDGLVCAPICRSTEGKFVLCSRQLPYAPVELEEKKNAAVLGAVDLEFRPLAHHPNPVVPARLGRSWTPAPLGQLPQSIYVGRFIRDARLRAGISFREASQRTRAIAKNLNDHRYYCSPSSLSDYEVKRLPPGHIHKLISICAVYFASSSAFLEAAGISPDKAGKIRMPSEFVHPLEGSHDPLASSTFFSALERRFGSLPYFLHDSIPTMFGLNEVSVRDVFWAGGIRLPIHPSLAGALFLLVDRRRKNPQPALSSPKWAQPIYVVQLRDGSYLCGFCTLHSGILDLRCCSLGGPSPLRLRNRVDAEVVGSVVGVVRQFR